jgi:hypothetical protein
MPSGRAIVRVQIGSIREHPLGRVDQWPGKLRSPESGGAALDESQRTRCHASYRFHHCASEAIERLDVLPALAAHASVFALTQSARTATP